MSSKTPVKDTCGFECHVGDVVFFEFLFKGRAIPRKGRITALNQEKQRIKVLSNKDGGYCKGAESGVFCNSSLCSEPEPGNPRRLGYHEVHKWREFWIGADACPVVIGDFSKKICEC